MKRFGYFFLFVLVIFSYSVGAQSLLPLPRNMVNDSAHIFSAEETARIEHILRDYRDTTTREILVVTLNDFKGYEPNSFTTELGNQWGIGKRGVNNGIIVLLCPSNMPAIPLTPSLDTEWDSARDNYITQGNPHFLYAFLNSITNDSLYAASKSSRPNGYYGEGYIATGRGIEGALPDVLAAQIMRTVVAPFFAAQRYAEGTEAGLYAIFQALAGDTSTISETLTPEYEETHFLALIGMLLLGYIALGIAGAFTRIIIASIEHAVKYLSSRDLRSRYSFMDYWKRESWNSAKQIIKDLPRFLLSLLIIFIFKPSRLVHSDSSYSSHSSSSGSFSGGGGSFGGGGGGSRF